MVFTGKHILTALLVATLDITAAGIQFAITTGNSPLGVLRFVASGVFGKEAMTGGWIMLLWGLLFHYLIACFFAFLFFFLVQKFPDLLRRKIALAVAYGFFMWGAMRFIVLPLSAVTLGPLKWERVLLAVGILVLCISMPLVWIAGRETRK